MAAQKRQVSPFCDQSGESYEKAVYEMRQAIAREEKHNSQLICTLSELAPEEREHAL